jgi:hypothetical protein
MLRTNGGYTLYTKINCRLKRLSNNPKMPEKERQIEL